MAYNGIDLIEKCVKIEQQKKMILDNILDDIRDMRLKIIIKVLIKDINRTIGYYKSVEKNLNDIELDEIDFKTYDRISFLINGYSERIDILYLTNLSVREYINTYLQLIKDKSSLFIDLQGRLYNNTNNNSTRTYEILALLIDYTQSRTIRIEKMIK